MRVAVIGAGPSGLVTLKYLKTAHQYFPISPIEAELFESEASIGGTFAHRTYEDAELVSSKQLTTFSDFRPETNDPDFLTATRYVEYLEDYCNTFNLWKNIHVSSPVIRVVRKADGNGHIVHYRTSASTLSDDIGRSNGEPTEKIYECDALAICSGLHVTPNIPDIPGLETIPTVLHSADFKLKSQFGIDKTVMILGSGETGMDIAYMAVTYPTKQVILCHRDGFLCAPKRVPDPIIFPIFGGTSDPKRLNVPVDSSSASLFDTAYVHPRLRDHMILWNYYDLFIKSTLWLVSGTKYGLDEWVGGISDERYHASKSKARNFLT
jgi:dimethylaniline monooxygenase (N-oxide forming)